MHRRRKTERGKYLDKLKISSFAEEKKDKKGKRGKYLEKEILLEEERKNEAKEKEECIWRRKIYTFL